jgi:hypothetical protein
LSVDRGEEDRARLDFTGRLVVCNGCGVLFGTEHFILVSGDSTRHLRRMADAVLKQVSAVCHLTVLPSSP